jgi:lipopolysaccharide export system ATP-binding protein
VIDSAAPQSSVKLHSEHLKKIYGKRTVVKDSSVSVCPGEIVGLLGPNGAGKTTTFYMITGLIKPDAGRVYLDGKDITPLPMYARARLGIGYLPQEASIFRKMTVEENLLAVLELMPLSRKARKERWRTPSVRDRAIARDKPRLHSAR